MNTWEILSTEAWVARLGWTLLHFLWQGLAIAVLYWAARQTVARHVGASARYLLACGALTVMMAAPVLTWGRMAAASSSAPADASYRIRSTPPAPSIDLRPPAEVPIFHDPPPQFLPWIVIAWIAGTAVFWARLAGGWVIAARMRSTFVRYPAVEWQDNLRRLGARIGVLRPVQLLVSASVDTPAVIGWLRPVVLVPVGVIGGVPAAHLEALLLHELAHIRRHDYLVNFLQGIAESLLFYHPAVWWISGHVRAERELCCDDLAVSVSGDAFTYASALAHLESCRPALRPLLAANGSSLRHRIAHILGQPRAEAGTSVGPVVIAVAALLLGVAYGLLAQSDEHPAFEVASIKPSPMTSVDPTKPMGVGYRPGGRMTATNASLKMLIQFAYADHDSPHWMPLMASRVTGGPEWIDRSFYNIDAKPAENTSPARAWTMLQTLLADRFHLALRRETRDLPVYELRPSKGGLRLPAPKAVDCISFPPGTPPHAVPGKADCGYVPTLRESGGFHMKGARVHMADFVRELSFILDRPVLDHTGFTKEFDLDLRFTADGIPMALPAGAGPADPDIPNLFIATEEQLGIKLLPAKGPVEVLVVDRAEKPSAN